MSQEKDAVNIFAKAMVAKLNLRKGRYKEFGWRDPDYKSIEDLHNHLIEEVEEFNNSVMENQVDCKELVDIANSAFMLWDRLKREKI